MMVPPPAGTSLAVVASDHKEIQVHKVHKDRQVDHRAHKAQRALVGPKANPVLWGCLVYKDRWGHRVFKVTKDIKG